MKNLICNAFYCKDLAVKAPGMKNVKSGLNIYLKNIFVSLVSALSNNPDCDVALITNLDENSSVMLRQLGEKGIKVLYCDFDNFIMPDDFKWQYAFYKLKALELVSILDYDNVLLLDSDTYCVGNLKDLWLDVQGRILLYDTKHSSSHPVRKSIANDWTNVFDTKCTPIQWGGEFVCANKDRLMQFVSELNNTYNVIREKDYPVDHGCGDEMFISFVAEIMSSAVRPANAYVERYWNRGYYLVSTNWYNDPVSIWHLPADKAYGMLDLYEYYQKTGSFPNKRKAAKILNLPYGKAKINYSMIRYGIRKLKNKF